MTGPFPTRRALLGGLFAAAAFAGAAAAQSISGSYRAEGRNPDGSIYTGTVHIQENGSVIEMNWQVGA
ncbi:hypothetical protein K3725_03965 [Leisingera sp. S132]|uniref:hypothetical protein n=1 Tax=Leisingera sp. S132 TaxID=2867016 RepID=UPI0021A2CB0D|nr:hypothetical protein [Leisingera sp. S132]UWQ80177.1 hypothetical protein K3725_03965 [Leisingera sp. S132]